MNELREIFDFGELQIITEKSKLPKYALAKLSYSFARADFENDNKRTYSEKILSREMSRKSEELKTRKIAGQLEHPILGITKLDKVAHVLNAVQYNKRTKLASAESFILDTSKGRDFMVMLEAELKMGASMRGWGNVVDGKVQSDWKFDTCDFVLRPSFGSDATIDQSNIIESANSIFDEKDDKDNNTEDLMMGINPEFVEAMIKSVYGMQIDEVSFDGSLEDFKKQKGNLVKAEILVSYDKFETVEEALKHLGADEEIKKISSAPIQKRVTENDVFLEAKMAGIHPRVYAETLNKSLEEKETSDKERSIRTEIEQAGALSGRAKLVQKEETYPDGEKRMAWVSETETPQKITERIKEQVKSQKEILSEDEKAKIVAEKTGSTVEFVKEVWAIERKKKEEEKIREIAIRRVSRDLDGSASQETITKMIEMEIKAIKRERSGI